MTEHTEEKNSFDSMRKMSPKFTVAFAAGRQTPSQSPTGSPEVATAASRDDVSTRVQPSETCPLRSKPASTSSIDHSITCSPLRLNEPGCLAGEGYPNIDLVPHSAGLKRSLQTAFANDTTVTQHHALTDVDKKRFAFGKYQTTSPTLPSSVRVPLNGTDPTNPQPAFNKPQQIQRTPDPNNLIEGNPTSMPGFDTRSALAALSVAYSSLFRNAMPLHPATLHATSFNSIPRLPLSDGPTKPNIARTIIPSSVPNSNVPLFLSLTDPQTTIGFQVKGHEKSPLLMTTANLAQPGPEPLPAAMSNMLSENLDCWQQFQQAAYANNLDPHVLALYNSAGCAFELSGTSRRKNATRETTSMLKTWLNEHRKNPYPTKGEKIMLAIVTKMSLTQVSTWFANARRRLKKENKVTWNVRNAGSSDAGQDSNGEEEDVDDDLEPDFEDVVEMEKKMDCLLNGRSANQDGLCGPFTRHHLPPFHSVNMPNAEHRLRNKYPVSTTKHVGNSELKLNPKTHQFRTYTANEEKQRKIWSLVDLAHNNTTHDNNNNNNGNNPPPKNTDTKIQPISGSQQSALIRRSEHEIFYSSPSIDTSVIALSASTATATATTAQMIESVALESNKKTGSEPEALLHPNLLPNFSANLMTDQRNVPLLSPAALAMFYMYYQQQQQQQQQLQSTQPQPPPHHHQQQPPIPQLPNPMSVNQLIDLEQFNLMNSTKQLHTYAKDTSQTHSVTGSTTDFGSNRLSASRWPQLNGYVVRQMTGSQADH